MINTKKILKSNGCFITDDIFEDSIIDEIKNKIDKKLNHKDLRERIESRDLYEMGILDNLFNKKIRYIINSIIPDGVLWHCMFLKTQSGQKKPHIKFNSEYGDWHRDRYFGYDSERIDFLDIMIYLNDVGINDGPFAFLQKDPNQKPNNKDLATKITGKKGTVIFSRIDWYHSATTNSGNTDRYMIRISLQSNAFHNSFLDLEENKFLAKEYLNKNDDFMSFIFGINRNWTKQVSQQSQQYMSVNIKLPNNNYVFKIGLIKRFKIFIKKLFRKY